jgi:hypothetical protein
MRQGWSVVGLVVLGLALCACDDPKAKLRGEVVFTRRDGDVNALYRVKANGDGEELLYRHTGASNNNVLFPSWSESGEEAYFTVHKGTAWVGMALNLRTRQAREAAEAPPRVDSRLSHDPERIEVDAGSVYLKTAEGRKQLYYHKNFDSKFNVGASEARWSPDEQHVIFQVCYTVRSCQIKIAPAAGGDVLTLTKGTAPVWRR